MIIDDSLKSLIKQIRLIVFDFDGVFTDNTVWVSEDGSEMVRCWRGDGIGLRKIEQLGVLPVIISTEQNPVVTARSRKLRVRCIQGCEDKESTLNSLCAELEVSLGETAYVGNDINDASCLNAVALPIVVFDAHPDVCSVAKIHTVKPGGYGAVREICDLFATVYSDGNSNE